MYEPSADARVSARTLRDFYNALMMEGFDNEQAMAILTACLLAQRKD